MDKFQSTGAHFEVRKNLIVDDSRIAKLLINPTYYGPFGATPDIGEGGHNVPPLLDMHVPLVLS